MPNVIPKILNIVDSEDVQAEVAVTDNKNDQVILSYTTKNNLKAYLAFVGMAWDAVLDTFLEWRVERNGAEIYNLRRSKVQIAAPEQPQNELTPYIELPQGCILRMLADVNGAGTGGNAVGRFKIYYTPLNEGA